MATNTCCVPTATQPRYDQTMLNEMLLFKDLLRKS